MTTFRIAVVGMGSISQFWLPILRDRLDVDVVALVDVDVEVARAAAERDGVSAPIFRTMETAVEATAPDVVVNLTPPEWHRPVVEAALGLGCHVLGEKPIATTLEDAQALVRAAEGAGRTYAVMQNRRFEHGIRTLREGLAAGRIGSVTTLACDFFKAPHFGGFRDAMDSPLLLDMAIHQFDQARFLVGVDPVAVSCHEFNPAGSWYRGHAAAICTFELADGSVFSYRGSWSAEGFGTSWNGSWRVVGTAGTALWDGEGDPVAEIAHAPEEPELLYPVENAEWQRTWDGPTGHAGCLDEMLAALVQGRRPETDASDNLTSFAMVLAALTSAHEGRRIELGELIGAVS
jgi:predicted dehydrogenase